MSGLDLEVITRSWPYLLKGLQYTVQLTVVAAIGGIIFGTLLALARLSSWRPLSLAAALRAPGIRHALERLHAAPQHDWSLEGLAEVAGLSRSAFAAKFKALVGESPLGYLRQLRVQRAMGLLARPGASIVAVANAVGYGDPFVFSKAFKKVVGVSPREFRATAALEGLPAAS